MSEYIVCASDQGRFNSRVVYITNDRAEYERLIKEEYDHNVKMCGYVFVVVFVCAILYAVLTYKIRKFD